MRAMIPIVLLLARMISTLFDLFPQVQTFDNPVYRSVQFQQAKHPVMIRAVLPRARKIKYVLKLEYANKNK